MGYRKTTRARQSQHERNRRRDRSLPARSQGHRWTHPTICVVNRYQRHRRSLACRAGYQPAAAAVGYSIVHVGLFAPGDPGAGSARGRFPARNHRRFRQMRRRFFPELRALSSFKLFARSPLEPDSRLRSSRPRAHSRRAIPGRRRNLRLYRRRLQ